MIRVPRAGIKRGNRDSHLPMIRLRRTSRAHPTAVAVVTVVAMFLVACEPQDPAACPCTLFPADSAPVTADSGESAAVELGVRFTSDIAGSISGVRFHKSAADTGTHTGSLWTADGALLATATFTDETTSGWQQVDFAQPVPIAAGGTYVASYHTDTGHFAADAGFFNSGYDNPPLHAPEGDANGNGVYRYGPSGFPGASYRNTNYWVDPVLVTSDIPDTTSPEVIDRAPTDGATTVRADATVAATFSEPVTPGSVSIAVTDASDTAVPGTLGYDAPTSTARFTPSTPFTEGTYRVTVHDAADPAGNHLATPVTWSFTVATPRCPCSIWSPDDTPTTADAADTAAAELGTRFTTDTAGWITGVRFYKAAANTGTHTGHVWNSSGTLLGAVTFTDESASGWQTALFANPVAVQPGASYVVSYHAPDGHYAADVGQFAQRGVDNRPLRALRDGEDGPNGVYHAGASAFPTSTHGSANYWVDVVFDTEATDTVAPTVRSTTPVDGEAGVPLEAPVSVTFTEPVRPDSVVLEVTDEEGHPVDGARTHDTATLTSTFQPTAPWDGAGTYTASVSGAEDPAGNTMPGTVTWTFTPGGPRVLWNAATPTTGSSGSGDPIELGVRFTTNAPGDVTGIRFYKTADNTGPHVGNLWSVGGRLLATATFTGESSSGWQEVTFDHPVPLSVSGQYVASYHTDSGRYAATPGYFSTGGACSGSLCAYRDGDGGANGVYTEGTSAFPASTYGSANYWVTPVFVNDAPDTTPPTVVTRAPTANATGVGTRSIITAGFTEPVDPDTITMTVTGSGASPVAGSVSYDAPSRVATFVPSTALASDTHHTVRVTGVRDLAGNTMAEPDQWGFTTARAVPSQGTGGPILLVTNPADRFTDHLGEILRAEGLNLFDTIAVGELSPTVLDAHQVIILGPTPVTPAQEAMLGDRVAAGGHLIGIRPDPSIADLFGLHPTGNTVSDLYLKIDTSTPAGAGLVDRPIQFHGPADIDELAGATTVATYSLDATHETPVPAVTEHTVGSGSAAAFTYDLARSIVQTRQGNPAWAGQRRLGNSFSTATDMFFGNARGDAQRDWVDLDNIAIPQADVQQRLLVNLITTMNAPTGPIPHFWYLPNGKKAAVMLTGDDHAHGGTAGRFDRLAAQSPPGCSVAEWTCLRATSYIFAGTPLGDADAARYTAAGFDIALHAWTGCADFTDPSLDADLTEQLAGLAAQLPSIPPPSSNRTHCVVWSNWAGQARVEASHGIRLDTNYYWWPPQLAATRPGLFTGSGIPMRFADTDGSPIDVYQVPTQITDESGQAEPSTIDTLLDNATGPAGHYAIIGVNAHTDHADSAVSEAVVASALAHDVPVVSADQVLTWLDARNRSSFSGISWSNGTSAFSITADEQATGLQVMLPARSAAAPFTGAGPGTVHTITVDGAPVPFHIETVKGLDYAVFTARSGTWRATYGRP